MTAEQAERYFAAYEAAIHAIGEAARRPRHLRGAGHLDQAVGAASALQPRPDRARAGRALSAAEGAGGAGARATTSASTSMPRRPTGWSSRSTCWSGSASSRSWRAGTASASWCRPTRSAARFVIDWLIDLARRSGHRADGAAGQGRLLGRRDQARPGRRAGRLSGLHAQDPHRRVLPRLRAQAAGGDRRGVPAVRHAQRADAGRRSTPWPARLPCRPVRVPVPARHGRAAVRGGRRPRQARPCRAASMRRSARTRRCWPIWCAGCWRTAPTPRSSTSIADPDVPIDELLRRSVEQARALQPVGAPHAAIALPRDLFGAARRTRRARPRQRAALAALAAALQTRAWRRRADAGRRRRARRPPRRCAIRPTAATWSARSSRPRRTWSTRRLRQATPRLDGARRAARAACLRRAADLMEARLHAAARPDRARGRQDLRQCRRRGARGGRLPALLRGAGRATGRTTRIGRSASVACISPWNFPLSIFTGQVAARARRRQCGARQAGRGDAADRRARRCALLHEAGVPRAACCSSCPATARSARGWSPIRRSRGVVFTGSTEVAQLDQPAARAAAQRRRPAAAAHRRDRRAERHDRRFVGPARAAGERCRSTSAFDSAPASAARRCACSACRRTSPTASCPC